MKTKNLIIILFILLQSCKTIPADFNKINCADGQKELQMRYSLFTKLDEKEIARRKSISVPTVAKLDELSTFSEIVKAVKNAPENAKFIAIDLRHYHDVELGNIVISNIKSDLAFKKFLKTGKFSQGFFSLINFGKDEIKIFPPEVNKIFPVQTIKRADLQDVEIVINISDSHNFISNMKFTENQKVSVIANRIKKPYSADFREASNAQFHFDKKWIMSVYSIEENKIIGGKDTAGFFKFVNNRNLKQAEITKFDKSLVRCYLDENGIKF